MTINFYNIDCIEFMKTKPDCYYDLAIVDPPYGIGFSDYERVSSGIKVKERYTKNGKKDWDKGIPTDEYFEQLFRVSKNQIIWGANYFIDKLPHLKNFIYWHKKGLSKDDKFNEGEIAFVSCGRSIMIDIWWNGFGTINSGEDRIHPTQKPIKLYNKLYDIYGAKDYKILDTHGGSFNSAISAYYFGFTEFVGIEIDTDYFNKAVKRFNELTQEQRISFDCC